jgi:hypothetical protein
LFDKLTKNEKFSYNLAIILAVNLTANPINCIIYISNNNSNQLQADFKCIEKIKEYLNKISKYEPMTWEEHLKSMIHGFICQHN